MVRSRRLVAPTVRTPPSRQSPRRVTRARVKREGWSQLPPASQAPEPAKPDDSKKPSHEPVLIVFGLTEKGLPQGSWFSGVDAEVAIRSAQLMKLRAIKVTSQAQRDLLDQLRHGQVFASDRLFAPVIQRPLYEALLQAAGDPKGDEASAPTPQSHAPGPRSRPARSYSRPKTRREAGGTLWWSRPATMFCSCAGSSSPARRRSSARVARWV